MHLHNVYFWLKEELRQEEVRSFEEGLRSLTTDPAVSSGHFGKPAGTEARDVVDNSYSYALLLAFDTAADHDTYQAGSLHLQFVEENRARWTRVQVYDVKI